MTVVAQALRSVRDLWLRTGLSPRAIERLADADAFGSLGLTRRQALWAAKALGRVGDKDDDLPLVSGEYDTDAPRAATDSSPRASPTCDCRPCRWARRS